MKVRYARELPFRTGSMVQLNGIPGIQNRAYETFELSFPRPVELDKVGRMLEKVYADAIGPAESPLFSGLPQCRAPNYPDLEVWHITRYFNDPADAGILAYCPNTLDEEGRRQPSALYIIENRTPGLNLAGRISSIKGDVE